MSIKVSVDVIGLAEMQKSLIELGSEIAGKNGGLIKNALFAAGRPVKARMIANAPQSEKGSWIGKGANRHRGEKGRLKRSIKMFREKNPRRLSEIVYVGPMLGKSRDDPNGAWYAAIVEFQGGKGGVGAGYARRALHHDEELQTIIRSLGTSIERGGRQIGNKNAQAVGARAKSANKKGTQRLFDWRPST